MVPGAAGLWSAVWDVEEPGSHRSEPSWGQETHTRLTGPSAGCSECVLFLLQNRGY